MELNQNNEIQTSEKSEAEIITEVIKSSSSLEKSSIIMPPPLKNLFSFRKVQMS